MRISLFLVLLFCSKHILYAQKSTSLGREVKINLEQLTQKLQNTNALPESQLPIIDLPSPDGSTTLFRIKTSPIMENQAVEVKTFNGESLDKSIPIRLAITPSGFSGIMHYNNSYYLIEPLEAKSGTYRIYNINEAPKGKCNLNGNEAFIKEHKNGRLLSAPPFPIGTQLRTFRMAAAATNKMTGALGGQSQARDKIVSIINAVNLIYEIEVAIKFTLISETITTLSIIFNSPASDPFVINSNFASSANAQAGFKALNDEGPNPYNAILPYSNYDIGHTFNSYVDGTGPTYYVQGQAGPTPCNNESKARGWTEFVSDAPLGTIVDVFAHETAHQFRAWHTFNAIGGGSNFCTNGWDDETAVEPGSGSTLMAYGDNCDSPTNYVLTPPNSNFYFHTKSIEQILYSVNNYNTCYVATATGNTPPSANAGYNYTIPIGTPFTLTGNATDPNPFDVLSYAWEQFDIATTNDKGAFGSAIKGLGGYSAVNSTASAPLFRSKILATPSRTFPDMKFVLNNANNPPDNEGEDLPQVGRSMKFRFTVRDNHANGGGVNSDEVIITVDGTKGPLTVTAPNGGEIWTAGSNRTITWNVYNTQLLSANVRILLSVDGGYNYPYVLASSTTNNGSAMVAIPTNALNTDRARIKIVSTNSPTAEFFDVSNANFTISSSCNTLTSFICPDNYLAGNSGSSTFNLGLTKTFGQISVNKSLNLSGLVASTRPISIYANNNFNTCTTSGNANSVVVAFSVSESGLYEISTAGNNAFSMFSIFNAALYNCDTFVGSNAYLSGNTYYSRYPTNITLNSCTTYYALVYAQSPNELSLNFKGTGNITEIRPEPSGFSYTYVAVSQTNNQIVAVSEVSNFTSLPTGAYLIYGVSYKNGFSPNTLLNKTITQAYETEGCLLFSSNSKPLSVIIQPCPSVMSLVNPADNFSSGNTIKQASASNGTITASNFITGINTKATYQAKAIELKAGFKAETGTVFKAEIGGCN